ncbi:synapse-associated protein 47kD isoform X1 [Xylocopa sonorina]|uniref:synapse-associated protein 47kD isoform X1 n=1 Tax=Xylocopa sonorina TaxID=1818115 RepID=UPI00403B2CFC
MFTGLTNQVSTWMGKKAEDAGTELPAEEKIATVPEGEDANRKDSPTKGSSKLDMLVGVKSQMTGWFSGGIPGLSRGAQGTEGEQGAGAANEAQVPQNIEGPVEQAKDDDASSATGGADSGPASLGSPTEDKEGQQTFAGVPTKALAGAKTLGGFLYSAVNKAGKTVAEAGAKIKKTVEENRLVAELNKEQEAFIANKQSGEKGEAVAPWVGAPNEDVLREECLSLSTDQRNFLRPPPEGVDFPWDFEAVQPMAQATLALDPNLESMRFRLVPKEISEENFWRNYFYRVSVLRQSHELNTMANQTENLNQTSTGTVDQPEVQVTTGQESSGTVTTGSNSALADSPGHEFVSDSMRVSDTDLEEVREGMKKLGMQPPKEEDWERELEAELKDYEVVTGSEERNSVAVPVRGADALDKDDWEKQIDELLANDDVEDLK